MRIAFFDSGIGGLTVLHEALKYSNGIDYLYYADTANIPYGTKRAASISKLVTKAVDFLMDRQIDALVLACNTATSVVVKQLRQKYSIPIIGMEPAIKPAIEINQGKKILLCATERTLQEKKLSKLIEKSNLKDLIVKRSLQPLVSFAEKRSFRGTEVKKYLRDALQDVQAEEFESIVLGCTHFLFFKSLINDLTGGVLQIVDGNAGTVKHLFNRLHIPAKSVENTVQFYSSDVTFKDEDFRYFLEYYNLISSNEIPLAD